NGSRRQWHDRRCTRLAGANGFSSSSTGYRRDSFENLGVEDEFGGNGDDVGGLQFHGIFFCRDDRVGLLRSAANPGDVAGAVTMMVRKAACADNLHIVQ